MRGEEPNKGPLKMMRGLEQPIWEMAESWKSSTQRRLRGINLYFIEVSEGRVQKI